MKKVIMCLVAVIGLGFSAYAQIDVNLKSDANNQVPGKLSLFKDGSCLFQISDMKGEGTYVWKNHNSYSSGRGVVGNFTMTVTFSHNGKTVTYKGTTHHPSSTGETGQ
jgi:hypothetical protein